MSGQFFFFFTGNGYVVLEYDDGGWDQSRNYGRGRGRGRGRNFRGRGGRGGYNGPPMDAQEDMGGYNQEAPIQGRGKVYFINFFFEMLQVSSLFSVGFLFLFFPL